MEPPGDRTGLVDKNEEPAEDKAAVQTPATNKSLIRRRELRERGAGRPRPGGSAALTDQNGAQSPQSSGRVLRNRSTRAVPAWLKDSKSDDEEDEASEDVGATKRRKVSSSRRKKPSEPVGSAEAGGGPAAASLPRTE